MKKIKLWLDDNVSPDFLDTIRALVMIAAAAAGFGIALLALAALA